MQLIAEFGFGSFAARYVIEKPEHMHGELYVAIFSIKFFSLLLCVSGIYGLSFVILEVHENLFMLICLSFGTFGEVVAPQWYLQGKEDLKQYSIGTFYGKVLLVLCAVSIVVGPEDLRLYALSWAGSQLFFGFYVFIKTKVSFNLSLSMPSVAVLKTLCRDAWSFLLGNLFVKAYNLLTVIISVRLTSKADIAIYDISFKFIKAFIIPFEAIQNALFPSILKSQSLVKNRLFVLNGVLAAIVGYGVLYYLGPLLVQLLAGKEIFFDQKMVRAISLIMPFSAVSFLLGTNTLVAFGYSKAYNQSYIIPSILFLASLLVLFLTNQLTFQRLIYLRVSVEGVILCYRLCCAIRYKLI